jgi:hypothetical protein
MAMPVVEAVATGVGEDSALLIAGSCPGGMRSDLLVCPVLPTHPTTLPSAASTNGLGDGWVGTQICLAIVDCFCPGAVLLHSGSIVFFCAAGLRLKVGQDDQKSCVHAGLG